MMAMDVVDTLRHERMLITRDVNSVARQENLVDRLRGIYRGQGIEVPDEILLDGVKALEEERFRYQPPKDGLGTRLARLYINRRKWLPVVYTVLGVAGLGWAVNQYGFVQPAEREAARVERLAETLPTELDAAYRDALEASEVREIDERIESIRAQAERSLESGDVVYAGELVDELRELETELELDYSLRIVDRTGERTGITRIENALGLRKFYLAVDAVDAADRPVSIDVTSTESGETRRVSTFGVEVAPDVYDQVSRDKSDDGDVDERTLATKPAGQLELETVFPLRTLGSTGGLGSIFGGGEPGTDLGTEISNEGAVLNGRIFVDGR